MMPNGHAEKVKLSVDQGNIDTPVEEIEMLNSNRDGQAAPSRSLLKPASVYFHAGLAFSPSLNPAATFSGTATCIIFGVFVCLPKGPRL